MRSQSKVSARKDIQVESHVVKQIMIGDREGIVMGAVGVIVIVIVMVISTIHIIPITLRRWKLPCSKTILELRKRKTL
jgi:hypothetical protein